MSAPQAAAITACTACAAVGGAAAGGAFSSGETSLSDEQIPVTEGETTPPTSTSSKQLPEEIKWYPLKNEIVASEATYTSKIGKEYENLLVGSYGTTGKENNKWWGKSFEQYEKDKNPSQGVAARDFSSDFSTGKVTAAFQEKTPSSGSAITTTLNKVCDSVYQKATSSIGDSGDQKKLRDDLWRYCSPIGVAPVFVSDSTNGITTTSGQIGDSKKTILLSTKDNINTTLWAIKQEEFFALQAVSETYFNGLHTQKNEKLTVANSLRDKCKEAYSKNTGTSASTASEPTEAEVEKYCSVKAISA